MAFPSPFSFRSSSSKSPSSPPSTSSSYSFPARSPLSPIPSSWSESHPPTLHSPSSTGSSFVDVDTAPDQMGSQTLYAHNASPEDLSTTLLMARLTLSDLTTYTATVKQIHKRPVTRPPGDTELALLSQEVELTALVRNLEDEIMAKSMDRALERDAEVLRALEMIERSEREDRRAAEVLEREEVMLPETQAQRVVGRKGFVVPERPNDRNGEKDEEDARTVVGSSKSVAGPSGIRDTSPKVECISCTEMFVKSRCIIAPCTHTYCHGCLISLVEACTRDESLYPLKCCKQTFPLPSFIGVLNVKLRLQFEEKSREFGTRTEWRVYCCNPRCSAFLGSSEGRQEDIVCGECRTVTCTGCKQSAHLSQSCQENADVKKLREMAKQEKWQTCPGCQAIVELNVGCYHMTCKCRTEFCYLCAARWKNCQCQQWDESRLTVDAERRVENVMGMGMRMAEPQVFERNVRRQMERLRVRHECVVHDWRNRSGGGRCEQCGDHLPIFLKICRGCSMLACRRCALNRL
ncbi:hypothetical protein AX17_002805 [Amanita inopinata Kibby_2008]|nr:hypothetical protein AX17_002805 [Amanita inopinata Kibby_2008]